MARTPMRRRAEHPRCLQCRERFSPASPFQKIHVECAEAFALANAKKRLAAERKAKTAERAKDRQAREENKSLRQLLAEAQAAVNAVVRERDRDKPCICCGKPYEPQKPGGSMDAGHWLSRSTAPNLRFDLRNIFGQRKNCNRPGGTTYAKFRAGVVDRIGEAEAVAVENDRRPHKWVKAEVRQIRDDARAQLRAMVKAREAQESA